MKHYELVPKKRWSVTRPVKNIQAAINYYSNKGYTLTPGGDTSEYVTMELETNPEKSDVR